MSFPDKKEGFADEGRRAFLRAMVAGGANVIAPDAFAQRTGANAFTALKDFTFIGQDGKPITFEKIKQELNGKPFTVSFGFSGCVDYCPPGKHVFTRLNEEIPGVIHIVINVNPEGEGWNQELRNMFRDSYIIRKDRTPTNINLNDMIPLYPTENGKVSEKQAVQVSINLGNLTNKNDIKNHSPTLRLYDGSGNNIAVSTLLENPDKVVASFKSALGGQLRR